MKILKQQSGYSLVEISLAVIVVAAVVLTCLAVFNKNNASKSAESNAAAQQEPAVEGTAAAPQIQSNEDLAKAEKALDASPVESSNDSSELDAELAGI